MLQFGLHLGMEIPGWPPENIEELAKRFEDAREALRDSMAAVGITGVDLKKIIQKQ
jgi:hypothetical protein